MLYSVTNSIGNAINGAINQQKATKGYFKFRLQNNSYAPAPTWSGGDLSDTMSVFGQWIIGYADSFKGESPLKSCYKFNIPLKEETNDACDKAYKKKTTQFIRIGTVLGICGATYRKFNNGVKALPAEGNIVGVVDNTACAIVK